MKTAMMILATVLLSTAAQAASTDKIQEKASETAQATGDWAHQTKEDFKKQMQKNLDELQVQISEMKKEASHQTGRAKTEINRQIATLQGQRDDLQKRVKKTGNSSDRAWEKVKSGLGAAMEDLKKGFAQAKKELSSSESDSSTSQSESNNSNE